MNDMKNTGEKEVKLLLFQGKDNERVEEARETIANWAKKNGVVLHEVFKQADVRGALAEEGAETILLSLGGDGTFLKAADMIAPYLVPILGINLGKLGFLSGLNSSELESGLKGITRGQFSVKELARLKCSVETQESHNIEEFTALNEVVVSRGENPGLADLDLFLDSRKVATYPGDGLIVSTPTGSTAYSLSCGGPLITRNTSAFSITPLNVHKLGLRPIICSNDTDIRVETNNPAVIEVDGKRIGKLEPETSATMTKSDTPTLMIIPDGQGSFFETVRNKLNWDKDRGTRI